jgi:hypothetical protein
MQDIFSINNSHFLASNTLVPQSHMTTIIALNADLWHKRKLESVVTLRCMISITSWCIIKAWNFGFCKMLNAKPLGSNFTMEATHLGTVPNLEVNPPAMNQIILFVATTHKHNRVVTKRRFSCQPQSTTSAYQYIFRTSGNASPVYTWIICQVHLHAALEKTGAMTSTHLHKCQSSIHAPDFRIVLSLWKKFRPKSWHFELLRCACRSHSWGI